MNYLDLLKDKNLKATPQRLAVLKILGEHTHPTIDELYAKIKSEYPSVSLATVYKNLNTLRDEGLIVEVNTPDKKMRYDIFNIPHIHVVCKNCGEMMDIDYDEALLRYKEELENKMDREISKLDFLVTVKNCKKCS